jgi:hypothetical protein
MMVFNANGRGTDAAVSAFEADIGFQLPHDYRTFLERHNGGSFGGGFPEVEADVISTVSIDNLLGLDMPRALDLSFWNREMRGEIPPASLLIGTSPGGGFFLLCCNPEEAGVYYYDHAYDFPSSADEGNTYFVAKDFGEFAKLTGIELE